MHIEQYLRRTRRKAERFVDEQSSLEQSSLEQSSLELGRPERLAELR